MQAQPGAEGGHGDAAAYLLSALDAAARARFEAHAAVCTECQRELAELRPVADSLALSVQQVSPSPQLRQRLLLRAHMTAPPPVPADMPVINQATRPRPMVLQRYSGLVAGAALAIAVASGGYAIGAHRQLVDVRGAAEYASAQLADTLSIVYQPNMVTRPLSGLEGAPQAVGKVVMAPDRNKAVVIAYSLPQIKSDESYQCWMTTQEEKRVDGGTFRPDGSGKAYWVVRLPEALAKYRWMGVTREAGKGQPAPQGPRVLGGPLI